MFLSGLAGEGACREGLDQAHLWVNLAEIVYETWAKGPWKGFPFCRTLDMINYDKWYSRKEYEGLISSWFILYESPLAWFLVQWLVWLVLNPASTEGWMICPDVFTPAEYLTLIVLLPRFNQGIKSQWRGHVPWYILIIYIYIYACTVNVIYCHTWDSFCICHHPARLHQNPSQLEQPNFWGSKMAITCTSMAGERATTRFWRFQIHQKNMFCFVPSGNVVTSLSIGLAGTCDELREMVAETWGSLSVRVFLGRDWFSKFHGIILCLNVITVSHRIIP